MVSLKFHDVFEETYIELEVDKRVNNINIIIQNLDSFQNILLDKSTSIKLSKELRKQIALLD